MRQLAKAFAFLALLNLGLNLSVPDPCYLDRHSGHESFGIVDGGLTASFTDFSDNSVPVTPVCPNTLCSHACQHSLIHPNTDARYGQLSLLASVVFLPHQNNLISVQLDSFERPPRV